MLDDLQTPKALCVSAIPNLYILLWTIGPLEG